MSQNIQKLPRSSPEAQGVTSPAILQFIDAVEKNVHELHSMMLVRHGQVVAEGWWAPYQPEYLHVLFSLSKSFTSTAIGMAVSEGLLSVNDRVIDFFPEFLPKKVSDNLAQMRVRQLLSMSTGHVFDTMRDFDRDPEKNWVRAFLNCPVKFKPGTHFLYNTGATYMLSAILQKITGIKLIDYLTPRLFEPLGIEGATWQSCPRGINTGGFGLKVRTEDIAKFGQLYLQKGVWNGQRILDEAWIAEASARQVSNGCIPESDWDQGYGYQFWRCRHNAYRGDGAFGQYCVVMPDQDAVLAITSGLGDMQIVLNYAWEFLLPAMKPAPLPADPASQALLVEKLHSLALPGQVGQVDSPTAAAVSGKVYQVDANRFGVEQMGFDFKDQACHFFFKNQLGEETIVCGLGHLVKGKSQVLFAEPTEPGVKQDTPVEASAVWTAPDRLELRLRFVETPFYYTMTCRFKGQEVKVENKPNVGFGSTRSQVLTGRWG